MVADPDQLVRQSLHISRREARRWLHVPIDQEDLVADGNVGLARAAQRFDPSRGVAFSTFALMYVRGAILDTIRLRARRNRRRDGGYFDTVSLDQPLLLNNHTIARHDPVDPRPGPDEMADMRDRLSLVEGLPPRERYALLRTKVDGATAQEVGEELGVSAGRVHILSRYGAARLRRRAG